MEKLTVHGERVKQKELHIILVTATRKNTYFSFDLSTKAIAMQCPDSSRKAMSYTVMDLHCEKP